MKIRDRRFLLVCETFGLNFSVFSKAYANLCETCLSLLIILRLKGSEEVPAHTKFKM